MTTDQRIKICFLMQSFETGGAERVGVNILNHIDTQNFSIELLVIGTDEGALKKEMQRHLRLHVYISGALFMRSLLLYFQFPKQKPDVLFVNMSHLNILVSMIRVLLPRKLVIVARETNLVSLTTTIMPAHLLGPYFTNFFIVI